MANGGTLRVASGAEISFQGTAQISSGRIEGNGTITAPTLNATDATIAPGLIAPGLSAGQFAFAGNLTLGSLATLSTEVGGTVPGTTHDALDVTGAFTAGGLLDVSLINGFMPTSDLVFVVVDSDAPVSGSFVNAANGARLNFPGGSFLVTYGANQVLLSSFAVPEPGEWALFMGIGLVLWAGIRRLRRSGK